MWTLKNDQGDVMAQGSGPCAYDPTRYGWVSGSDLHGDPHKVLVYENLEADVSALVAQIDADVDLIYLQVIGNRQAEYEEAERQAQAFQAADFEGAVPSMVQSHATPKGWTAMQAAQDILGQAAAWRGAQNLIRQHRLMRKEQARSAETSEALQLVEQGWSGFNTQVRQQLGI